MELNTKIDYLKDGKSFVILNDKMLQDTALKVVNVARVSYNKNKQEFDDKDKKLTSFLWNAEHLSPFRHSYFTFNIKAPIFLFNQLKKYQVGSTFRTYEINGQEVSVEMFDHLYDIDKGCSWNEVSGRYVQTSDEFYIPNELRSNPPHGNKQSSGEYLNELPITDGQYHDKDTCKKILSIVCDNAIFSYKKLIKNGVAKEIARMILPQSMYSMATWTVSLNAVLWFLHQRLKPDAQFEIRLLAEGIYNLMREDLDRIGITKEQILSS